MDNIIIFHENVKVHGLIILKWEMSCSNLQLRQTTLPLPKPNTDLVVQLHRK